VKATPPVFTRPEEPPKLGFEDDRWAEQTTTVSDTIPTFNPPYTQHPTKATAPAVMETQSASLATDQEAPKTSEECASNQAWSAKPLPAMNTSFFVPDDITYNPAGPTPDQIVVVTATDGKGHNGGIEDILGQTEQNRETYCNYHGYHYHFVNISKFDLEDAHPVWKKLPAIVDAFNTYPDAQWLFFLDLDAIVMSPKQDLTSLVLSPEGMRKSLDFGKQYTAAQREPLGVYMPRIEDVNLENIDMLVAQDQNGINAGSFFLRRSKFTQWLLDMWADPFFMKMDWAGREQDTLLHFVKHHRTFREHLGLIKQRVANSYSEGGPDMTWQEGDLIIHFAGCWVDDTCQERWKEFWNKRATV